MEILKTQTPEEFVTLAVTRISNIIESTQADGGSAVVGLCGGSTPKPVYAALSKQSGIDWKRVTFFLLDERYVLSDDKDSNTRMIHESLMQGPAQAATLITPDTTLPLQGCIVDYDKKVAALGAPTLVIIGMGDDGHITSLFPPVGPEAYGPAKVIHTTTDSFAVHDRITTTFPVLQSAKSCVFLVTGEAKAKVVEKMRRENEDLSTYPAQAVFGDQTTWILG